MITQTINLHLVPDAIIPTIYLEQYDNELVQLRFHLVGTNSYYTIPTGTYVTFVGAKPDGKAFSYACTWNNYSVIVDVTDQMTAVAGTVMAQLRFSNASGIQIMSSIKIRLIVERSPLDGLVCSKNDLISIDRELNGARSDAIAAQNYANQAHTYYNNTVSAGTTAISNINSAKNAAISDITLNKANAVTAVQAAQTVGENALIGSDPSSAVNVAKSQITSATNTATNAVQAVGDAAIETIGNSEDAAYEAIDTMIAEMISYSEDPNKVIYEYFSNNESLRITALATQITVDEPNSVTYVYDNTTNTLTFTAAS